LWFELSGFGRYFSLFQSLPQLRHVLFGDVKLSHIVQKSFEVSRRKIGRGKDSRWRRQSSGRR
jgi:hypothetical protein